MHEKKIRVFSTFSGVGGLDKPFEDDPNFELVGCSENDSFASSVLAMKFKCKNYGDITKIVPKDLPHFDLLVGGFPCTDISFQGKQEGFKGKKSSLFKMLIPIIQEKMPKFVLLENVEALLSSKFAWEFSYVKDQLEKTGYQFCYDVLDSSNFGTPQQRRRVFILGIRRDVYKLKSDSLHAQFKSFEIEIVKRKVKKPDNMISWSRSTRDTHIDHRIREDGLANTCTTGKGCNGFSTGNFIFEGGRLRLLTPEECEELMGWEKEIRCEVFLCLDQVKNYVDAVEKSPKLLKFVLNVEKSNPKIASIVESLLNQLQKVESSVLENAITKVAKESSNPLITEELKSLVKSVGTDSLLKGLKLTDLSAPENVSVEIIEGQRIQVGKVESHLKGTHTTNILSGKKLLNLFGCETKPLAEDVERSLFTMVGSSTSITSSRLDTKDLDMMLAISYLFAKNAITGFTPKKIPTENLLLRFHMTDGWTKMGLTDTGLELISLTQRYRMIGNGVCSNCVVPVRELIKRIHNGKEKR